MVVFGLVCSVLLPSLFIQQRSLYMSMTNNKMKDTATDALHILRLSECYRYLA